MILNMSFKTILYTSLLTPLCFFTMFISPSFAQLTVNGTNNFISYTNIFPGRETNPLVLISYAFKGINVLTDDGNILSLNLLKGIAAEMIDPPLVYPNPMRVSDGAILGYGLTKSDMDLQLRIYDLFGYEILRKEFDHGTQGAFRGYNRVELNSDFFENRPLSAGVYIYVFIYNEEVIGKGKFAVVP
jgi:hypothetical protein